MRPATVVSSANLIRLTVGCTEIRSFVYKEYSNGECTRPCGAPVLTDGGSDKRAPIYTYCLLSVRHLVIHWQISGGTSSWRSMACSHLGMRVLKVSWNPKKGFWLSHWYYPDGQGRSGGPCWLHQCIIHWVVGPIGELQWIQMGACVPFQKRCWWFGVACSVFLYVKSHII